MSIARGLVGWWRFDGNLTDASGNANHGTVGAGSAAYAAGVYGQAWDNDETRFINAGIASNEVNSPFTFVAWIRPTSIAISNLGSYRIFTRRSGTGSRGFLAVDNSKIVMSASAGGSIDLESSTITANDWFFVVGVFRNGSPELYINGDLIATGTQNLAAANEAALIIGGGANPGNDNRNFLGQIDNAMIHNYALTPSEIKTLYALGSPL